MHEPSGTRCDRILALIDSVLTDEETESPSPQPQTADEWGPAAA
jgi:hypothetical protein